MCFLSVSRPSTITSVLFELSDTGGFIPAVKKRICPDGIAVCVCVCVCEKRERQRETEREKGLSYIKSSGMCLPFSLTQSHFFFLYSVSIGCYTPFPPLSLIDALSHQIDRYLKKKISLKRNIDCSNCVFLLFPNTKADIYFTILYSKTSSLTKYSFFIFNCPYW